MEIRIDTQKQTLAARDESIKMLMEMMHSKGMAAKQLEEDKMEMERLRTKSVEEERHLKQLETMLEAKDREMAQLKEVSTTGQLKLAKIKRGCTS